MSTLNVIGEFFESWEETGLRASARDLTIALAETAPRGCASSLLIASNSTAPQIDHPRARVEVMPLVSSLLPLMWRGGPSARPLDGEFVHALSPLVPLRKRDADDGSQISVTVLNTLAWDAPEVLPKGQAKQTRQLMRRAVKHAHVIVTPTHAVAQRLREIYGEALPVQVLPLAAPSEYLQQDDASLRRTSLGVPEHYMVSTAYLGEVGRLEWLLRALEVHPELPPLVLLGPGADADLSSWGVLGDRVTQLKLSELNDIGAVLGGAHVLAMPQRVADCLLPLHGALTSGVPVVHGEATCISETVIDGGTGADTDEEFAQTLVRVTSDADERERLSVLAHDRSRMFSWQTTAWQLWEIHANI